MTYNEKKSLYESIMMNVAKMVKRQINEMTPDIYKKAASVRRRQGNTEAAKRLEAHAGNMSEMLIDAINNDNRAYIINQYPKWFFEKGGQICCYAIVIDPENNKGVLILMADNVKDLLKKLFVVRDASTVKMDPFFKIKVEQNVGRLSNLATDDISSHEFDDLCDIAKNLSSEINKTAVTVEDIKDTIEYFDFGF